MRKTIAAVLAALLLITVTAGPARADGPWWPISSCPDVGANAQICLDVYSKRLPSGGLTLDHVYVYLQGWKWEDDAYACDYVEAWNDNAVVKWEKDGPGCDLVANPNGVDLYHPNQSWPGSAHLEARTCGYPHLDAEGDPGRVCIHVNIP